MDLSCRIAERRNPAEAQISVKTRWRDCGVCHSCCCQELCCFGSMSRIFNTVYHWFFCFASFLCMLALIGMSPAIGFFAGCVQVLYRGCGA